MVHDLVYQRSFTMVDVGDDGYIAYLLHKNGCKGSVFTGNNAGNR